MSTPETNDDGAGERRRRRRAQRQPDAEQSPPMSRREMRARGILLTTEVPLVEEPPDWPAWVAAEAGDQAGPGDVEAEPTAQPEATVQPEAARTPPAESVQPDPEPVESSMDPNPAPAPAMTRRALRALTGEIGVLASEEPTDSAEPEAEPEPEAEAEAEPGAEPASAEEAAEGPDESSSAAEATPEAEATTSGSEGAPSSEPGVPSRRALRDRLRDAEPSAIETPAERTVTGRRPVVRTPVTARGVRTVDESGAISAVQPAVPAPVAWAPTSDQPTVPPQPSVPPVAEWTTSPASWESAVSIPAVVMGIEDRHEPPTGGQPITPPRTELTDSALPSVSRQSLRQGTPPAPGRARGLPGTAGQPKAPEATAAWSSLIDEQEASVKKAAEALSSAPAESAPLPSRRSVVQAPAGPEPQRRDRRSTGGKRPAGSGTGESPSSGVLKIVILVAIGLAIGALIYMIATGALASIFADGVGGTAPGGVALAGFLAGWPRLTKEFRDR